MLICYINFKNNLIMSENKPGVFALICSFLFPIVGIICFFVNRKTVKHAEYYLIAAFCSFVLSLIIRGIIASSIG